MGRDPNTPAWTQHLALQVDTVDDLLETKARLEADGIEVVGPTDHTIFKSIYFFDPSGHRLELAANTGTPKMAQDARRGEVGHARTSGRRPRRHRSTPAGCTTAATQENKPR